MEAAVDTATAGLEVASTEPFPFLVAAYSIVFVMIFGYLVTIHVRQRRMDAEIDALERRASAER